MATAKDLLRNRSVGDIFSIAPEASVQEAIDQLAEHNVGALLVIGADGNVAGILSERDIVRRVNLRDLSIGEIKVEDVMTSKVLYVEAGRSVEECMALMNEKSIRHLPVYENKKLLGLISIRDVLRTIISEQQLLLGHLEQYIRGG